MVQKFNIPLCKLGQNGPLLPALGLGCMIMLPSIYGNNAALKNVILHDLDVEKNDKNIASGLATLFRSIEHGCTF
ncbi:hypothetical protein BDF19DRAFT_182496 [Syncephalis fuscata]|nr:hypothetical protein BDF19DRAFT_182496 [Syncephalis fuscata]